ETEEAALGVRLLSRGRQHEIVELLLVVHLEDVLGELVEATEAVVAFLESRVGAQIRPVEDHRRRVEADATHPRLETVRSIANHSQRRMVPKLIGLEEELRLPDRDAIAVEELRLLDVLAVDADGVLAAEIAQSNDFAVVEELRVLARNERVVEDEVILRAPADRRRPHRDLEDGHVRGAFRQHPKTDRTALRHDLLPRTSPRRRPRKFGKARQRTASAWLPRHLARTRPKAR